MRDIKFRAWDKKYEEMINDIHISPEYDWLVLSDNDALAERDNRDRGKNQEYVLMQYTGLEDENGVEIYEGDVIKIINDVSAGRYRVSYWGKEAAFMIIDDFKPKSMRLGIWFNTNKIEVIGNIYENPELLK